MHRSKLSQIVIDVPADRWEGALGFWTGAFGLEPDPRDQPGDRYLSLIGRDAQIRILLQRCEWPGSYHLDIETDDVEAEVKRLEALGAERKKKVSTWWVMKAPTGHDFCVIRRQDGFERSAIQWPEK